MYQPPRFQRREFRKASRSTESGNNCVLVARRDGWVELRDSKREFGTADDARLVFTAPQFDAFLSGVRRGELVVHRIEITAQDGGRNAFHSSAPQAGDERLWFTTDELRAFYCGVRDGEFADAAYAA